MHRILTIDDHEVVREGVKGLFGAGLAEFGEARSGAEAISLIRDHDWDVAILDISLAGRSGLDVLKEIKQLNPKLPVLILSMTAREVDELQGIVATVSVDDSLVQYLMRIVAATRDSEMLDLGVSPRGTLALFRAAQALALTEERTFCIPDDIKRLVVPVFAHRIVVSSRFASSLRRSEEAEAVLNELLKTVSVPL